MEFIINKSINNECTEEELKIISEYFGLEYSEIINYNTKEDMEQKRSAVGVKDFSLATNLDKLLMKLLGKTQNSGLIWVPAQQNDKFCSSLPITEKNSMSIINIEDNYVYEKQDYKLCFFTSYKGSRWIIRQMQTDEIILTLISENEVLTYNSQKENIKELLDTIKLKNGVM